MWRECVIIRLYGNLCDRDSQSLSETYEYTILKTEI